MALNQALASKPINRLTPEAARAQVVEHIAEAQQEFWKNRKFAHSQRAKSKTSASDNSPSSLMESISSRISFGLAMIHSLSDR